MKDMLKKRKHVVTVYVSDFSVTLKNIRKKNKMTQKELAIKIGVDQGTYSRYEASKSVPDLKTSLSICRALNVSTKELLGF